MAPSALTDDYHTVLSKLLASPYITAVINETLRVMAPVPTIPKYVPADASPQSLVVDGKEVMVPPGTMIKLCVACVHRNPKYWPHQALAATIDGESVGRDRRRGDQEPAARSHWTTWPPSNPLNDLEAFLPERWLESNDSDGAMKLISPPHGAFVPFSDGPRACLGKRFAQVELLAALAVVFSSHSVELVVDDWAGGERLENMTKEQRKDLWEVAAERANNTWRENMGVVITLQLRGTHIPMRFVERGKEMFF
jgi:hypothetical protein